MAEVEIKELFLKVDKAFARERAKDLDVIIQIEVIDDGLYYLVIRDGNLQIFSGKAADPRITLKAKLEDFIEIFERKLKPETAFFQGRLLAQGDIHFAMKMADLFSRLD